MGADAIRLSVRNRVGRRPVPVQVPAVRGGGGEAGRPQRWWPCCSRPAWKPEAGADDPGDRGPAGPGDAFRRRPPRLFTPDDLLEFHFLLQDDERLARELSAPLRAAVTAYRTFLPIGSQRPPCYPPARMSAATVTVLALVGASLVLLVVMGFGLVLAMKSLTGSVRDFQRDVRPILDEIQRGAVQAQGHRCACRSSWTRSPRAGTGPGGRPRRAVMETPAVGPPRQPGGDVFNIGPTELIVILVIALIVFGPKRLPEIGRHDGQVTARAAQGH